MSRAASVVRHYELRILLAVILGLMIWVEGGRAQAGEKYVCEGVEDKTLPEHYFEIWDGGAALRKQISKESKGYCGYTGRLSFNSAISEKDVLVLSGFFDNCSQGTILLFNKKSLSLSVLSSWNLGLEKFFQCKEIHKE